MGQNPLRVHDEASEIASADRYLASPEAAYVTGTTLACETALAML